MMTVHLFISEELNINTLTSLVLKKYLKGGPGRYAKVIMASDFDRRVKIEIKTEEAIDLVLAIGYSIQKSQEIMERVDQEFKTNNHYCVGSHNNSIEEVAKLSLNLIEETIMDPYRIDRQIKEFECRGTSLWEEF